MIYTLDEIKKDLRDLTGKQFNKWKVIKLDYELVYTELFREKAG